ncbi:MAG: hypothetical protein DMG14_27405 [Acidobacteria bacterium]|nr:MAG: hypothetical protein DMG14_27405 [Acidobacteriota bacterium]
MRETGRVIAGFLVLLLCVGYGSAAGGDRRLVEAVKNGDNAMIRSLLEQHVDVNVPQPDGATALAWAAHRNDLETADLLLRAGAGVNAANELGATPLWLAASKGNTAMAEKLLSAGADADARLLSGETVLMAAARIGNIELVKSLIAHHANVNAKETRAGQTALMWAAAENQPEVVRVLMDNGADVRAVSKRGVTPFLFAVQQGSTDSARILLAAGTDVNAPAPDGRSPLLIAAAAGRSELALLLLSKGADPNATDRTGFTVLHHAAAAGKLEIIKALLARGVNPDTKLAKDRPNAGPNSLVDYPLVSVVAATPLFLAAEAGYADAVRLLAMNGADPNIATKEDTTPLIVAAGAGQYQDLADEQAQEEWEKRHFQTIKVLVELGVDVNAVGENGWTALHGAAYMGLDSAIQLLVEKGAKTEILDRFGQTPLSIAEGIVTLGLGNAANRRPRNVRRDTADLLLKLGATPVADSGVEILYNKGK